MSDNNLQPSPFFEIFPISDLPAKDSLEPNGNMLVEGSDKKAYRISTDEFIQWLHKVAIPISTTETGPFITNSWYKPRVNSADPGTPYPNLAPAKDDNGDNTVLKSITGYDTLFYYNGTYWISMTNRLPGSTVPNSFNPNNAVDPQGGKQINDYYTKKTVVKSRNLINPAAVDFDHYYSDGPKAIVDNTGFNWVVTGYIPVKEGEAYTFSHETVDLGFNIGGYFVNDTDTTAVANITDLEPQDGYGRLFVVPTGLGIKFVRLDLNTTDTTHAELAGNYQLEEAPYHSPYTPYFDPVEITSLKPEFNSLNNWSEKHITHAGTSIPAGYPKQFDLNYRYPDIAANRLGAIMNNISVPSSTIRMTKSDGSPVAYPLRAFSNEASTVNYQNAIIDKLNGPEDPALVALDFGVNDYVADQSDIDNYATFDMTSEDRATFIGATNFVIKKILQTKPTQRIVLLTHFTDTAVAFVSSYANLNKAIEHIGKYWGIPVCRVYDKTGWVVKNGVNILGTMCPDGIHPASMSSDYSVQQLSRIYGDFIEGI